MMKEATSNTRAAAESLASPRSVIACDGSDNDFFIFEKSWVEE